MLSVARQFLSQINTLFCITFDDDDNDNDKDDDDDDYGDDDLDDG